MKTKFEKVRVRRAPDGDRVLYPSTPRPSGPPPNTSAPTWPLAQPSRARFATGSSTSQGVWSPIGVRFLFDGSRINPNQTPKDVRFATRPVAGRPARSRTRIRSRGVPRGRPAEATAARRKHCFVVRFDRSQRRLRLVLARALSPLARHGGRRRHARDDGAGRRALIARGDLDAPPSGPEPQKRRARGPHLSDGWLDRANARCSPIEVANRGAPAPFNLARTSHPVAAFHTHAPAISGIRNSALAVLACFAWRHAGYVLTVSSMAASTARSDERLRSGSR